MNRQKFDGLSSDEARKRLLQYGPNLFVEPDRISFFRIARHEITEPMILLLLVVGFLYSLWGNLLDSITIFAVIVLLVLAEVHNEYRAKKAIASLERITAPKAKVVRDGRIADIDTAEVVHGDLLVLSMGTSVSADARITEAVGLQIDESALTGESFPQDKQREGEIYAGTTVLSGEGEAEVFATGKETRIGNIAASMKEVKRPRTPLQIGMKSLVKKLVVVAGFFCTVIPVLGIIQGRDVKTMILTGLSLSFATIPEELPIIITMVLGLGAYTLSKSNFVVKRLNAAEAMGNTTVIVTDKTGTITEGKMKIAAVYPESRAERILADALGSTSGYVLSPMETEIKKRAEESGAPPAAGAYRQRSFGYGGKKTKAVIRKDGGYQLFVSGAPEEVFECCTEVPEDIRDEHGRETARGRRVIAVASKRLTGGEAALDFQEIEKDMFLTGLISFEDGPREGVRETVAAAARAGVRTIMVTGDHALTAAYVAKKVGIPADMVYEGKDIDGLDDRELREKVRGASVFARTVPQHKYRIVKALQEDGEVVAVTGDGVNDVLALKGADIGIAMGIRGTDVAKDAAAVVLADDNYVTIAQGIFEGRKFFDNLQKGIRYYLSVKAALILIFLLPVVAGVPMPFSPIQIVVLELFMDLAASAGFVSEPAEGDIFTRPPRSRKEEVLSGDVIRDIFINGAVLFLAVMLAYFYARHRGLSLQQTQTAAFSAWIFGHITLAYVSRSDCKTIFSLGFFTNRVIALWTVGAITFLLMGIYVPFLSGRFSLASMSIYRIALIAVVTLAIIGSLEVKKAVLLRTSGKK